MILIKTFNQNFNQYSFEINLFRAITCFAKFSKKTLFAMAFHGIVIFVVRYTGASVLTR